MPDNWHCAHNRILANSQTCAIVSDAKRSDYWAPADLLPEMVIDAATVPQSQAHRIPLLRSERCNCLRGMAQLRCVLPGHGRSSAGCVVGSNRQHERLRARQLPMGYAKGERSQPIEERPGTRSWVAQGKGQSCWAALPRCLPACQAVVMARGDRSHRTDRHALLQTRQVGDPSSVRGGAWLRNLFFARPTAGAGWGAGGPLRAGVVAWNPSLQRNQRFTDISVLRMVFGMEGGDVDMKWSNIAGALALASCQSLSVASIGQLRLTAMANPSASLVAN